MSRKWAQIWAQRPIQGNLAWLNIGPGLKLSRKQAEFLVQRLKVGPDFWLKFKLFWAFLIKIFAWGDLISSTLMVAIHRRLFGHSSTFKRLCADRESVQKTSCNGKNTTNPFPLSRKYIYKCRSYTSQEHWNSSKSHFIIFHRACNRLKFE